MLSQRSLGILQHSLGLDEYGQGPQYRNHYVAGGEAVIYCRALVVMGFMEERKDNGLTGGSPWFSVKTAGILAVSRYSPIPPKRSRAQQRYLDYLDADTGYSFAEFMGIEVPSLHAEMQKGKWRYRYDRTRWNWSAKEYVTGEWGATKKEAKASYKAALKKSP